ncbi:MULTISPECIES: PAS domain-containing sensor histidine kinase [Mesobacillus]|uniref:PAS domain-containing sensor histidine kinase n=1 Tax=Mesobacillus TaxID=2675231 RepID=UPI0017865A79|nr:MULTISPECIES: PAS domain-containing sensor histidine kinase [Mesobacillus]MCM3573587.1 PAS domain S-box protein [Mesobacillus subterraneus]UYZ22884.1 PAS domain S-box protein [Mesobacillus jeotgali]
MKKKQYVLIFFILSIAWIFGTNYLLNLYAPSEFVIIIEHTKEVLYVLLAGWFFYFFISKMEELSATKEEEERLSTLINSMVDFVNFKDGEGRWIQVNDFGLKLFDIENVDYRGKKDSELAEYSNYFGDALRYCEISDEEAWKAGGIIRVEEVLPQPDGTTKTFDTIKVPLFNDDGSRQGLVIMGRDITERKHVETLLEESRQQYRSLFEYSPDIVSMLDLNGTIINLNPQFERITGFSREEYIGKKLADLIPDSHRQIVLDKVASVVENQCPQMFELELLHKSGKTIFFQSTSLPIIVNDKIAGIICNSRDVTELRQTEERLRRTDKLSVVGELSASVAHEIRNPLTSLKGLVQLLQMEDEKHQLYYQIMIDELNRINHIVSELLLLAKPQQIKYTEADLQGILHDVISLLKTEASLHNIQIEFQVLSHPVMIECEPNQLKQLFINIVKNAIEASAAGDVVNITLQSADNNITVVVKDQGVGISKELLERIGEPFYSSKEKGTGLGMTVSFKIVQSHNGTIKFRSEPDKGTEVIVQLPIKHGDKVKGLEATKSESELASPASTGVQQ